MHFVKIYKPKEIFSPTIEKIQKKKLEILNRPGVAGAVLQTPLSVINRAGVAGANTD